MRAISWLLRTARQRSGLLHSDLARRSGNPRVFGTVARGQGSAISDLGLLVDLPEATGLFALLAV